MSDHHNSNTVINRSVVPFTGGVLMLIYAFFWPESYGTWLGLIVKAFRVAAGI